VSGGSELGAVDIQAEGGWVKEWDGSVQHQNGDSAWSVGDE
jgi:hypothetical protein